MIRWTVEDAATHLDPAMTAAEVQHLIYAARLQPSGQRRTGRRGRPAPEYDAAALMRAHAGVAPFLVGIAGLPPKMLLEACVHPFAARSEGAVEQHVGVSCGECGATWCEKAGVEG